MPAPVGGWRLVVVDGVPHVLAPGKPLEDASAAPETVSPELAHWTPDGRALYHWDRQGMYRRELDGTDRLLHKESMIGTVVPSPDGKTLYFSHLVARSRRQVITNFGARPRPR